MKRKRSVLVLFSGGIDSTACIYYYKQLGFHVDGLFVDYGQISSKHETIATKKLSKHFAINTKTIKINSNITINKGEILGRNNFLLSVALMNFPYKKGLISLGIHGGTNYPDCSKEFINRVQEIFDLYSNGNIVIDCPFLEMSKREIFEFCKAKRIPLNDTYSCENGSDIQPCGVCATCKDLLTLYKDEDEA